MIGVGDLFFFLICGIGLVLLVIVGFLAEIVTLMRRNG